MALSGNIQSIKEGHSIKEAVVFFTVSPSISNPKSYKELIMEKGDLCGLFQRFEPVKNISVNFNQQTAETSIEHSQDSGFKLLAFENGELISLIQGINQFDKAMFTFNTLRYEDWEDFWNEVKERFTIIAKFNSNFLVKSFGLLYIDEFKAVNPSEFQISQLFNLRSKYVPSIIASSNLINYNLDFQKEENGKKWAENLMVNVDNTRNAINIYNNITFAINPKSFSEMTKSNETELAEFLNFAHCENKKLLKDFLKSEIVKMIGL